MHLFLFYVYFSNGKKVEKIKKLSLDLSKGDILQHIRVMSIPAMMGQFFNSMYNWIDTFWGGRISPEALAAFTVTFPVFLVSIALGQLFASGVLVLISNAIGAKNLGESKKYLAQSVVFSLLIGTVVTVLVIIFGKNLLMFLGATGQVLEYGEKYLSVLALGFPFLMLLFTLSSGFSSRGDNKFLRNVFIMNVCINMVLDPLLLYGISWNSIVIIPEMGIQGIALATVLVQVLGAALALIKSYREQDLPKFSFAHYRPRLKSFTSISYYGFPTFLQIALVSAGLSIVTYFLFHLSGNDASAAYGLGLRIEQMALIPSFGLSLSLSALIGQNNGAKKFGRILSSYRMVILLASILLICVMLPLTLLGYPLTRIFTDSSEVIRITRWYLFFALAAFLGYQTLGLSQAVLQGMKKPKIAVAILILRQLVLPVIVIPIMVYVFRLGVWGVFSSVVINVWICAFLMRFFALRLIRKSKKEHEESLELEGSPASSEGVPLPDSETSGSSSR